LQEEEGTQAEEKGRHRDEKDLASERREKIEHVLLTRVLEKHHRSTASIRDIVAQLKKIIRLCVL
jgi:hypothetical protein